MAAAGGAGLFLLVDHGGSFLRDKLVSVAPQIPVGQWPTMPIGKSGTGSGFPLSLSE